MNGAKGGEKIINVCLEIDHTDMVNGGEMLRSAAAGRDTNVGVVNSPCYSDRLKKSLALAHVAPDCAAVGTSLIVTGEGIETTALVVSTPVYDPRKLRTHST